MFLESLHFVDSFHHDSCRPRLAADIMRMWRHDVLNQTRIGCRLYRLGLSSCHGTNPAQRRQRLTESAGDFGAVGAQTPSRNPSPVNRHSTVSRQEESSRVQRRPGRSAESLMRSPECHGHSSYLFKMKPYKSLNPSLKSSDPSLIGCSLESRLASDGHGSSQCQSRRGA